LAERASKTLASPPEVKMVGCCHLLGGEATAIARLVGFIERQTLNEVLLSWMNDVALSCKHFRYGGGGSSKQYQNRSNPSIEPTSLSGTDQSVLMQPYESDCSKKVINLPEAPRPSNTDEQKVLEKFVFFVDSRFGYFVHPRTDRGNI
jgi:hypothetical protein